MGLSEGDKRRLAKSVYPGGVKPTPVVTGGKKGPPASQVQPEPEPVEESISPEEDRLILTDQHLSQISPENLLDSDVVLYLKAFIMRKDFLANNRETALSKAQAAPGFILIAHEEAVPTILAKLLGEELEKGKKRNEHA